MVLEWWGGFATCNDGVRRREPKNIQHAEIYASAITGKFDSGVRDGVERSRVGAGREASGAAVV